MVTAKSAKNSGLVVQKKFSLTVLLPSQKQLAAIANACIQLKQTVKHCGCMKSLAPSQRSGIGGNWKKALSFNSLENVLLRLGVTLTLSVTLKYDHNQLILLHVNVQILIQLANVRRFKTSNIPVHRIVHIILGKLKMWATAFILTSRLEGSSLPIWIHSSCSYI